MRVCYFGTYERDYPRNALMIAGLRQMGVSVTECHAPVWERQQDKSGAYRGMAALGLILQLLWAYIKLTYNYLRTPAHDVVIVGYIGQFDMLFAWFLTRLGGVPLLFNPLVSLYDTFCDDRSLVKPTSLTGRLLWWLDYLSCQAAELVFLDTEQHRDYFVRTFGLHKDKFFVVPVGADDRIFQLRPLAEKEPNEPIEVLFVGKLIPLHGIETILQAAAQLRHKAIHFTIVGSGQQAREIERLIRELQLDNVTRIDWVEYARLGEQYAKADLCLGIFGASDKAQRVIPNKVYQALAVGRPVITADSPAIRTLLTVDEQIIVCSPANPDALANQIAHLAANPSLRQRLARQSHALFERQFSIQAIGATTYKALTQILPGFEPENQMDWGDQPAFYGPRHRFRVNYLLSAIQHYAPGDKILDAACGAGNLARHLAAEGYDVYGVDLSNKFLKYLSKQQVAGRLTLLQGDITKLPFDDNQLDGIVAGEVLEHLEDDGAVLRECWRVLREGGVCVISVPAEPSQWDWHDNWAGHVRRYRREELTHKLEREGFTMLKLHHFGFPFVRAFHRYLYLPRYRRNLRTHAGKLDQLTVAGWRYQLASTVLLGLFQLDNLFNRWPLGIGLIAVAKKPAPKTKR